MSEVHGATYEIGMKAFPRQGAKNASAGTRELGGFEAAVTPEACVLHLEIVFFRLTKQISGQKRTTK
jgi:hypothetical protein